MRNNHRAIKKTAGVHDLIRLLGRGYGHVKNLARRGKNWAVNNPNRAAGIGTTTAAIGGAAGAGIYASNRNKLPRDTGDISLPVGAADFNMADAYAKENPPQKITPAATGVAPSSSGGAPGSFNMEEEYRKIPSSIGSPRLGGGPANEVGPPDPNLFKTGPSINPGGLGSSLGGMLPASMQASLQNSLGNEGYARLLRAGGHAGIGAAIGLGGGALHGLLNPSDKKRRIRSMLMDALAGGAVGGLTGGVVGGVDPLADVASSALSSMGLGGS